MYLSFYTRRRQLIDDMLRGVRTCCGCSNQQNIPIALMNLRDEVMVLAEAWVSE